MARIKPYGRWLIILGVGGLLTAQLLGVLAANGTRLYLYPPNQVVQKDQTFNVAVRISSNQSLLYMSYVKAYLNFPANILSVTKVDTSTNAYQTRTDQTYSNTAGTIHIEQSNPYSYSPDQFIATIGFKAIKTGTATVSFSSDSWVSSSQQGANTLTGSDGGTYTIQGPAPAPAPAPSPKPQPTTSPTASPSHTNTTTSTTPTASSPTPTSTGTNADTSVGYDYGYDYAILVWHTPALATAEIRYGLDNSKLTELKTVSEPQVDFNVTLSPLKPGRHYFFTITATDISHRQINYQGDFTTKGYPVELSIVTDGKKPIKGAQVHVADLAQKSPASGKVTFNLPEGIQTINVSIGKKSKDFVQNIEALAVPQDGSDPTTQRFTLLVPGVTQISLLQWLGFSLVLLLLPVIGFGFYLFKKGRQRRLASGIVLNEEEAVPLQVASPRLVDTPPADEEPAEPKTYPSITRRYNFHPNDEAKTVTPKPKPTPRAPKKPAASKSDAPNDEPKDIFEIAEERFEQDERLKNFRDPED